MFLVGAPLSCSPDPNVLGVPDVDGVISLVKAEFTDFPEQLAELETKLIASPANRYQEAFWFLQGRRGQKAANEIVRKAVLLARNPNAVIGSNFEASSISDDDCRLLEEDPAGWLLTPGLESLGTLIANYPKEFGETVLTTNFDPLIEVAIRRAGGQFYKTMLHADGYLGQTEAPGCHVIHLHGSWFRSDTLHTPTQLGQERPRLKASLASILKKKIFVVLAYGGWDDTFTDALMAVLRDDGAHPEILWAFYSKIPEMTQALTEKLAPGIDRGNVTLYAGIECHSFLSKLYSSWCTSETPQETHKTAASNPVIIPEDLKAMLDHPPQKQTVLEGDDEDRPPVIDICVGRDKELETIRTVASSVVFLTGLGGQGKSTVAAQYFEKAQRENAFSFYVWRDCKEERERFENQLASVVETLTEGRISRDDLAQQSAKSIIEILMGLLTDRRVLFVFDNVDHHVNLEYAKMIGSTDAFIQALLRINSSCRAIFTCRPTIRYTHPKVLSFELKGLDFGSTRDLFKKRGASAQESEIEAAHRLTEGHAFWLDLIAIQVAKRSSEITLTSLLNEIRSGAGILPETTLNSIWETLRDREQTVLRGMAETVKPETEEEIGEYLSKELTFNKVHKALNALKGLNLIVVKRRSQTVELLELHPLVRHFIRNNFSPKERVSFIEAIILRYQRFIGNHKFQLTEQPPLSTLLYWTQNAELDIEAGRFEDAFPTLAEVSEAFMASAYSREFCRAARLLLAAAPWSKDFSKFKGFETVFRAHIKQLSYLGEHLEIDGLLDEYEKTVPEKDARYIHYCDLRCFTQWIRANFSSAVKWGTIGRDLKQSSGVDTQWDVSHTLALAERDAGHPESALTTFLLGRSLTEVIDPAELDEKRGGAYYGNIGRCLQFMGQTDWALVCYQKSAVLIEKDLKNEHVLNQGYIRLWVGEIFLARQQLRLATIFFRAAHLKWQQIFPSKAANAVQLAKQTESVMPLEPVIPDQKIERICLDWIAGRPTDASLG